MEGGKDGRTHLLMPILRTLPLATTSSSACHVGYGSAVRPSSSTVVPFLNAIGLRGGARQHAHAEGG